MHRLTEQEKMVLRDHLDQLFEQHRLRPDERHVADTAARLRYIQFATQAVKFYKGEKPVRFLGNNGKL